MSVRECYSDMSDEELDQKVRVIKGRMPHAGFRMIKGSLRAMGNHVQWRRVMESLQRADGAGIIANFPSPNEQPQYQSGVKLSVLY